MHSHESLIGLDQADLRLTLNPGSEAQVQIDELSFVPIPEPGTLAVLGMSGLLLARRRW